MDCYFPKLLLVMVIYHSNRNPKTIPYFQIGPAKDSHRDYKQKVSTVRMEKAGLLILSNNGTLDRTRRWLSALEFSCRENKFILAEGSLLVTLGLSSFLPFWS